MQGQKQLLENPKLFVIETATAQLLQDAIDRLQSDFPGLVPQFNIQQAFSDDEYYTVETLRAYVATALGILEVQLEDEPSPVVETRVFTFVTDAGLKRIIERDYVEIQRAWVAQCWKSVIILAGGAIEAILTDLLLANQAAASTAASAPQKTDITKWDLAQLIDVAVELKFISGGVSKLSHPVREFRNLVHPGNELRNQLVFGPEEARIAIEVIHMLHRDLSP